MANGVITDIVERLQIADLFQRVKSSIFIRQVSLTFIARIAIVIMGFTSSIITARYLGPGRKEF